jgi:hypothetical protein
MYERGWGRIGQMWSRVWQRDGDDLRHQLDQKAKQIALDTKGIAAAHNLADIDEENIPSLMEPRPLLAVWRTSLNL